VQSEVQVVQVQFVVRVEGLALVVDFHGCGGFDLADLLQEPNELLVRDFALEGASLGIL
jgi:hypothetical protein